MAHQDQSEHTPQSLALSLRDGFQTMADELGLTSFTPVVSDRDLEIIRLHDIEGRSFGQIGKKLGMPMRTVQKAYQRAMQTQALPITPQGKKLIRDVCERQLKEAQDKHLSKDFCELLQGTIALLKT